MPEGPEVSIIAGQLNDLLAGSRILRIELQEGLYSDARARINQFNRIAAKEEINIDWVKSKGKLIYWRLTSHIADGKTKVRFFANHLGMTGHWREELTKHTLVVVHYGDGKSVYFDDYRHMGRIWLYKRAEMQKAIDELGPDVLKREFTETRFRNICQKSRRAIGVLLVDQKILCGIGNYLRADILYKARLDPRRRAIDLQIDEIGRLYEAIREVSQASLAAHGTTIKTYSDIYMRPGGYFPLIYGRDVDANGNPVETFTLGGRTMHWVPAIQE